VQRSYQTAGSIISFSKAFSRILEDDSGLELLVNGKVISLDLSVKEVYQNVVLKDHRNRPQGSGTGAGSSANAANIRENDPTTWQFL